MPSLNGELLLKKVVTFETLGRLAVLSPRQLQRLAKEGVKLAVDRSGRQLRGRVVIGEALPKLFAYARESGGDPAVCRFGGNDLLFLAVSFARNCSAMALATSLSTEKMSVSLRSKVSAQRWESLAALIRSPA